MREMQLEHAKELAHYQADCFQQAHELSELREWMKNNGFTLDDRITQTPLEIAEFVSGHQLQQATDAERIEEEIRKNIKRRLVDAIMKRILTIPINFETYENSNKIEITYTGKITLLTKTDRKKGTA